MRRSDAGDHLYYGGPIRYCSDKMDNYSSECFYAMNSTVDT